MPKAVEESLRHSGRKKGYRGKGLDEYVYATLTKLQEQGKIGKWRTIKHSRFGKK